MLTEKFIIKGRLPSLNEITDCNRGNKYSAAQQKKRLTEDIAWEATRQHIKKFKDKVFITLNYYEPNNRRDDDNVQSGGAKFILDGLQMAGVIINDSRKYVSLQQNPVMVDKENPRIEVFIEEFKKENL